MLVYYLVCLQSKTKPYRMNYIYKGIFFTLIFVFAACSTDSQPKENENKQQDNSPEITSLPYQEILLNDLSAFSTKGENWQIVKAVNMDYQKEQSAEVEAGTGVLFNSVNDTGAAHIFSTWEHADLEIEFEAMLPKGSNSGVYFMSRYEIQLFDSWLIDNPQHSDLGGIYQRWKDDAPEGQQGYEGHAPKINAAKAPGLWQKFYVQFTAPRFDAQGNKIANARFDKVVLNGYLIHEDVELLGPTRAASFMDEVEAAPLMVQGDHGKVALRNIHYKRFFNDEITLTKPLNYKYYEPEEVTTLPDFSQLEPASTGTIDSFLIDRIIKRDDNVAIQYSGEIQVPQSGDYIFHTISDDGTKLYIDDELVVNNDGNHGALRKSGLINLKKGTYNLRVDYYNNTWGRSLRVLYQGPGMKYQTLVSAPLPKRQDEREPILLNPKSEPELLRSFVMYNGEKRTHAISVGDPEGVHFSIDLDNGALLKVWRGGFADVTNMWQGRGEAQTAVPQAAAPELSDGVLLAALPNSSAPYPGSPSADFKLEGYDIAPNGRPTFKYSLGGASISDRLDPGAKKQTINRTLEFNPNGTSN
jgi:hypothetical protein